MYQHTPTKTLLNNINFTNVATRIFFVIFVLANISCASGTSSSEQTSPQLDSIDALPDKDSVNVTLEALPSESESILVDANKQVETKQGERLLRGEVIENKIGCTVDATCYLLIIEQNTEQEIMIIYGTGRAVRCLNTSGTANGLRISEGTLVEILAAESENGTYSLCNSQDYYIKELR